MRIPVQHQLVPKIAHSANTYSVKAFPTTATKQLPVSTTTLSTTTLSTTTLSTSTLSHYLINNYFLNNYLFKNHHRLLLDDMVVQQAIDIDWLLASFNLE